MGCDQGKMSAGSDSIMSGPGKNDTVPIIVVSQRKVSPANLENFKAKYLAAGEHYQAAVPGLKALFMSIDKKDPSIVHDIQWFNDLDAFNGHIDMNNATTAKLLMDWVMQYDMSMPFQGDVFGGWNQGVIDATAGKGAQFSFRKSAAGFIRQNTAKQQGPPVILSTKRWINPGS